MAIKDRAKLIRQFIEQMAAKEDDATALEFPEAYPKWETGKAYEAGYRCRYGGVLYKVLQNHVSQADWTPDVAVSLYVRVSEEEFPEWVQPTGAHDAYNAGDKVSHMEKHWVSLIDANTYEPSVYGWEEV